MGLLSIQISPPWSAANVCDCRVHDKRFWSNLYESGVIRQIFKCFPFANGYSLKWDRVFTRFETSPPRFGTNLITTFKTWNVGVHLMYNPFLKCSNTSLTSPTMFPTHSYTVPNSTIMIKLFCKCKEVLLHLLFQISHDSGKDPKCWFM